VLVPPVADLDDVLPLVHHHGHTPVPLHDQNKIRGG
jgi:hypothetical protein